MSTTKPGQDRNERTLGQLVASATQDFSTIIRGELALAKAELGSQVKKAGLGGVLLAVAGVIAFYSVYFVFITIAEGLTAAGLPKWLSYLIVTVFFLLVAGVLALLGIRRLKTVDPKPERTIAEANETVVALRRAASQPRVPDDARPGGGTPVENAPVAAARTPTQAAHAAPVSASSAPGIAPGSPEARAADTRVAEARAAASGAPAPPAPPPGTTTTSTDTTQGWAETAADAVASGTGVSGPADLTDHPVSERAPAASTAALPRTRAEAKAQAEAKAHAEARARAGEEAKHGHHTPPES